MEKIYDTTNRNWTFTAGGDNGLYCGLSRQSTGRPAFGALIRAPLSDEYQVYGLIYDIRIDDDGLVRQLVTSDNVSEEVMQRQPRAAHCARGDVCAGGGI